jgi:hypothetical protein
MRERIGHIAERRLPRVGRIYPVELRVGRRGSKDQAKG